LTTKNDFKEWRDARRQSGCDHGVVVVTLIVATMR
jgi:hypothetical protein